jgi:hypothetical protein
VPGVSMGLATGLFFQIVGLKPSLLTITAVQALWALPFAFLIILTELSPATSPSRQLLHRVQFYYGSLTCISANTTITRHLLTYMKTI